MEGFSFQVDLILGCLISILPFPLLKLNLYCSALYSLSLLQWFHEHRERLIKAHLGDRDHIISCRSPLQTAFVPRVFPK